MRTDIWITILASFGILITGYIAICRAKNKRIVCPINSESCNEVIESEWSSLLGIRNEIIGLIYYILLISGVVLTNSGYFSTITIIKVASTIATLCSIFLVMVQTRIIKKFCSYCFLTAVINTIIFMLLVK